MVRKQKLCRVCFISGQVLPQSEDSGPAPEVALVLLGEAGVLRPYKARKWKWQRLQHMELKGCGNFLPTLLRASVCAATPKACDEVIYKELKLISHCSGG